MKLTLPDIAQYLSHRRYLVYVCMVKKELKPDSLVSQRQWFHTSMSTVYSGDIKFTTRHTEADSSRLVDFEKVWSLETCQLWLTLSWLCRCECDTSLVTCNKICRAVSDFPEAIDTEECPYCCLREEHISFWSLHMVLACSKNSNKRSRYV